MYSDPTGHNTLDDYEYQKNVEKRRSTLSSTLDNYAYQNTTKKTSSRQSNSLDNYYYNQDMSDAHLLQQTREQQKAPQTITSTAKSTTNDSAMISFLLNPDTSAYLTSGQYQQTLAWVDQERIDRGGSILISGLQLSTDPTSKGYNERDLALYQAINKITCFNGDIGNTDKLLGALENRYTALGIDSSNALNLDAQGMKNLSAVAAERNTAINGGTGFNLLKFQEENLYTSGIISTTVTAATYGGLMTTYAGSGPQKTSKTNSDIIDAQVAKGNVEYAKTMNALTDEQWAAMSGSGEAGVAEGAGETSRIESTVTNTETSLIRTQDQQALHDLAKESVKNAKNGQPISESEAKILDELAEEYGVPQHHQAYPGSGQHFPGGNYSDHTHIYNEHVPYK